MTGTKARSGSLSSWIGWINSVPGALLETKLRLENLFSETHSGTNGCLCSGGVSPLWSAWSRENLLWTIAQFYSHKQYREEKAKSMFPYFPRSLEKMDFILVTEELSRTMPYHTETLASVVAVTARRLTSIDQEACLYIHTCLEFRKFLLILLCWESVSYRTLPFKLFTMGLFILTTAPWEFRVHIYPYLGNLLIKDPLAADQAMASVMLLLLLQIVELWSTHKENTFNTSVTREDLEMPFLSCVHFSKKINKRERAETI